MVGKWVTEVDIDISLVNKNDNNGICTISGGILTTSPPCHCKCMLFGGDHP